MLCVTQGKLLFNTSNVIFHFAGLTDSHRASAGIGRVSCQAQSELLKPFDEAALTTRIQASHKARSSIFVRAGG